MLKKMEVIVNYLYILVVLLTLFKLIINWSVGIDIFKYSNFIVIEIKSYTVYRYHILGLHRAGFFSH